MTKLSPKQIWNALKKASKKKPVWLLREGRDLFQILGVRMLDGEKPDFANPKECEVRVEVRFPSTKDPIHVRLVGLTYFSRILSEEEAFFFRLEHHDA